MDMMAYSQLRDSVFKPERDRHPLWLYANLRLKFTHTMVTKLVNSLLTQEGKYWNHQNCEFSVLFNNGVIELIHVIQNFSLSGIMT